MEVYMRKVSKILMLVLVLVLTVCCIAALSACVDNNPTEDPNGGDQANKPDATKSYVFYVVNEKNEPVAGVKVQLCVPGDEGSCFIPITTDENGCAVTEGIDAQVLAIHLIQDENSGKVLINDEASNYTFDNNSMQTEASYGEYNLKLVLAE